MGASGFSKSLHVLQDESMSPFSWGVWFLSRSMFMGSQDNRPLGRSIVDIGFACNLHVSFCNCVICVFSWRVGVNALLAGPAPSLPYWASERPQRAFNAPLLYSSALLMYLYLFFFFCILLSLYFSLNAPDLLINVLICVIIQLVHLA